ncbi:MAG: GTP cyclohydrolase II [Stackebrandtia sp.]
MTSSAVIDNFSGEWEFLSNYYPGVVEFEGDFYPALEHAYQAAKTTDVAVREQIRATIDPDRSKELGRANNNRPDWDEIKPAVMRQLVRTKFSCPFLGQKLLDTGDAQLIEGNTWGDVFWGVCDGVGENVLGQILMEVRASLQKPDDAVKRPRLDGAGNVIRVVDTNLSTRSGDLTTVGYTDAAGQDHLALVAGDVAGKENVLVRVHSECFTGDVLESLRCDCGEQLQTSLNMINAEGAGVVVYLRGHEGRGIGLLAKLRAYYMQDSQRLDTVDANVALGLPVDARDYSAAAGILSDLGVRSIRLLSNNPAKLSGLAGYGIEISARVPLLAEPGAGNRRYLATKRDRMDHQLPHLPEAPQVAA